MDEKLVRIQRSMAWERAKGELRSMLHTFFTDETYSSYGQFNHLDNLIEQLIREVEDNALHE